MPFEKDGFLAPEMSTWIVEHRKASADLFDLAERFNRHAHSIVTEFRVGPNYGQQMVCTALYLRALDFFQGVILMAERGMVNDAKVLHRTQLEATFACCAVAKSEEVMKHFVAGDAHTKEKALSKLKRNADAGASALSPAEISELEKEIVECKKVIAAEKPLKVSAEWLAHKADMTQMYLSAYVYLSAAVHSGVRDIEQYLSVDSKGDIAGFLWGPDDTLVKKLLVTSVETLSFVLRAMESVYGLAGHDALYQELVKLGEGVK